jgi:protein SCO1/2
VHPRLRLVIVGLVLCAAAAIAAVSLADRGSRPEGRGFAGARRPAGVAPADFALRDQDGALTRLAAYRGKVVILTFMYTRCRDTCPIQADQVRGALDDLGEGASVQALAISVDPAGDTPDRAKAFLARHGLTGRMRFLLGTRAQLAPLWRAYGIQPQGQAFDHSSYVLLVDRRGRQRVGFPLDQLTPEGLTHDARLLVRERRRA